MCIKKIGVVLLAIHALVFSYSAFTEEDDPPPCSEENECEELVVTGQKPFPSESTWCDGDVCPPTYPGYEPIEPIEPTEQLDENCDDSERPVPTGSPTSECGFVEEAQELMCNVAIEMAKQVAAVGSCSAVCEKKVKGVSRSAIAKRVMCITGCTILVEAALLCE